MAIFNFSKKREKKLKKLLTKVFRDAKIVIKSKFPVRQKEVYLGFRRILRDCDRAIQNAKGLALHRG